MAHRSVGIPDPADHRRYLHRRHSAAWAEKIVLRAEWPEAAKKRFAVHARARLSALSPWPFSPSKSLQQAHRRTGTGPARPRRRSASTRPRPSNAKWWSGVKWPFSAAQPDHGQHDRAERHVHAVEAGEHEERRAVDAAAESAGSAWCRPRWYSVRLEVEEQRRPAGYGRAEPDQQRAAVAGAQRVVRDRDGDAGADSRISVFSRRQAPGRHGLEVAADRRRAVGRPCRRIALPRGRTFVSAPSPSPPIHGTDSSCARRTARRRTPRRTSPRRR